MKRLFSPLVLVASFLACTGIAAAAVRASYATSSMVLDTGSGTVTLTAVSGVGLAGKGPAQAKNAAVATPKAVDVRYRLEGKSAGLTLAIGFISGKATATDASIKFLDQADVVKQMFNLGRASIVELELPGADAKDSKQALEFRLRLQPASLGVEAGTGAGAVAAARASKGIMSSNFRVTLGDEAQPNVTAVSPCVVRRVGHELQIEGLGVTLPLAQALSGTWMKWAGPALAGERVNKDDEKVLRLEYLDGTLSSTLLTMDFSGVGIEGMDLSDLKSGADQVPEVTFRLYARDLQIKLP